MVSVLYCVPVYNVTCLFVGDAWESGFFDEGSFIETLGCWAQTVVCGRAR